MTILLNILVIVVILASILGLAGLLSRSIMCEAPGKNAHPVIRMPYIMIFGACAVIMYYIGVISLMDKLVDYTEGKKPAVRYERIHEPTYRQIR